MVELLFIDYLIFKKLYKMCDWRNLAEEEDEKNIFLDFIVDV